MKKTANQTKKNQKKKKAPGDDISPIPHNQKKPGEREKKKD